MTIEQHQVATDPQTKQSFLAMSLIQVVLSRLTITISRSPKKFVCSLVFGTCTCTEVVLDYKFKIP